MPAPKRKKTLISDSDSDGSGSEDLDKELLSLSKKKKANGAKASGGSGSGSESETSSGSDDEWTGKGGKKKVKKKKKKSPPPRKRSESSSEDEGSNSEGEENAKADSASNKSGSESGSDNEAGSDDEAGSDKSEEFNDGYDENLMGDEEDRRRLELMTEKEREQELFNRIEQREVLKTRFEIERKLKRAKEKEQKRKEKKTKDSTSPVAGRPVDAGNQRVKEVEAKKGQSSKMQKLNELKLQREKKKQEAEARDRQNREEEEKRDEDKKNKKKLNTDQVFSSSDESGKEGSDDEGSGKESGKEGSGSPKSRKSRSSSSSSSSSSSRSGSKSGSGSGSGSDDEVERQDTKPKVITTKEELARIRLSRFKLEKWVHAPFFVDTVMNCFVRVNIGTNMGQPVYRVAEVVDVKETQKVYYFGSSMTNKALRLRYAKAERDYRLEYISNSEFIEKEFQKWVEAMTAADMPLPSLKDIEKKQKAIKEALAFKFNEAAISKMVEEKEKFRKNPINYAMRKTRLHKAKEIAEQSGEAEKAEDLKAQLEELEERAADLDRQRTKNISSVTYINERNRVNNIKKVERALESEYQEQKDLPADPFRRRNTAPTMVTMAKDDKGKVINSHLMKFLEDRYEGKPKSVLEKERQGIVAEAPRVPPPESPVKAFDGPKVNSTGGGGAKSEDLFSCHDFDVAIDLDMPSTGLPTAAVTANPAGAGRLSAGPSPGAGPRRTLNLEDYKRKKGLI